MSSVNIGKLGEDLAVMFLKKRGFDVFTRNLLKKYGEIDIIATKDNVTHFVEVKSVSRENFDILDRGEVRPEENLHSDKLRRLSRVTQVYLIENPQIMNWQFDLCVVYIDILSKKAKISLIEDLVLPE